VNELTILSTDSARKDEEQIFTCTFENRRKVPLTVLEFRKPLFELKPGEEFLVEMWDASVTYAPFSKVEFLEGDQVKVKRNPEWALPKKPGEFQLELLNEAGSPIEAIYPTNANETPFFAYKGIPRFIAIPLESKFIRFRRIVWRAIKEKVQDRNNPDFLIWSSKVERVFEPRSKSELDEIEAALKARSKLELEKLAEDLRKLT